MSVLEIDHAAIICIHIQSRIHACSPEVGVELQIKDSDLTDVPILRPFMNMQANRYLSNGPLSPGPQVDHVMC